MAALANENVREVVNGGARRSGLAVAVTGLVDAGVVGMEGRRGERGGRVRYLVAEEEVKQALRGDKEIGAMVGA